MSNNNSKQQKINDLFKDKTIPTSCLLFYIQEHIPKRDKVILIECENYDEVISITNKLLRPTNTYHLNSFKEYITKLKHPRFKYYYTVGGKDTIRDPETGKILCPDTYTFNNRGNPYNNKLSIRTFHELALGNKKPTSEKLYIILNFNKRAGIYHEACMSIITDEYILDENRTSGKGRKGIDSKVDAFINGRLFDALSNNFPEMFCFSGEKG